MSSTASLVTIINSGSVLGKRKPHSKPDTFVLHLSSSPEPGSVLSDSDFEPPKKGSGPPILVNGTLVAHTKKRYKCPHVSCEKSYSKPSRLAEHERSHTGLRPFICETCNKSYLRETHLQAHARSHLPESDRPLACPRKDCEKRFWTAQHLRVHEEWHNGPKLFHCSKEGCKETFAKNHQLRSHLSSAHAAPGTKPYPCDHDGCMKSFATNQHLRTHMKIHDDKRYTCVHLACLPSKTELHTYFPTWTALQHHIRTAHPPTCSHASCDGRIFSSQKGLRAHQKLHEQRDLEIEINSAMGSDNDGANEVPPRKKRRGGEIGRDWKCEMAGCGKDFKSKRALATHTNITHWGRRDHICPHGTCKRAYGYKHLLRRHLAKAHDSQVSEDGSSSDDDEDEGGDFVNTKSFGRARPPTRLDIDTITGHAYAQRTRENVASAKALQCPYPHLETLPHTIQRGDADTGEQTPRSVAELGCEYAFSRAYDLRRHLKAVHDIVTDKISVDKWVQDTRKDRHHT